MSKLSKKEVIKEIIRCGKDPIYFIDNYAKIQHPTKGLLPFKTYSYQQDIIHAYLNNRLNIFLKARQLGITTITAAYIAWLILFHKDKNVLVVATKQKVAKNAIRTIRNIYKYLPRWMLDVGKIDLNNRFSIELQNGSRVQAETTTDNVGRSEALSLLVVDEVAHIKGFDEIWTGLQPTISEGGAIALFSTPNGTGNFFHRHYIQAQAGENNFNCKIGHYINPRNPEEVFEDRLMWWVHPTHDEAWFDNETRGRSPRDIAQEYLCNFNASGDTFIYYETINQIEKRVKNPIRTLDVDRNVWIWEEPDSAGTYLIACDVSRGDATDYSGFHVVRLDCHPLVQVAEYKGKIKPDRLGVLLVAVSKLYHNAIIAPENNSGWSGPAIMKIQEANHPFLYYSRKRKSKYKDEQLVDPYYAQDRTDFLPGYTISAVNRNPMLAKVEQYVRMGDIVVNSSRLLEEMKTFIVNEFGRPEAQRGMSDDLFMALAGLLWVRDEAFLHTYRTDEVTKAMLESMSCSSTKVSEIKDMNYNSNPYDRCRVKELLDSQNKMVMANGDVIDLNWLLPVSKG
jgi:hypothetical protein